MIYTITFNPSLDYIIKVSNMQLGKLNRSKAEGTYPGGKGINVSIVLKRLGIESVCLGFVAGFVGKRIEHSLKRKNCKTDFVHLENGNSRINVKIFSDEETEINCQGPVISRDDLHKLFDKIDSFKDGDIVVLAGNIPSSLPDRIYRKILERLKCKDIKVVVDARRDLLVNILSLEPFLIKPNKAELEEIFETTFTSKDEIINSAKKLQEKGAKNVLVSLGKDGALLVSSDNDVYYSEAPKGAVVNSVGSGDAMIAGFLAGYLKNNGSYEKAFKLGLASGSANAFTKGYAHAQDILALLSKI